MFLFHTVLRNKLKDLKPTAGERLAIRYEGLVASEGTGRRYHDYSVAVLRDQSDSRLRWDDVVNDDEPEGEGESADPPF